MISTNCGDDPTAIDGRLVRSVEQRELILDAIHKCGHPLSLSGLEAALVDGSDPTTVPNADGDLDDEFRIRLHHVHLPKLDRSGAIEYDASRRIVRPRPG